MALNLAESELREKLLRILPGAAESGLEAFTNSRFNPYGLRRISDEVEGLLTLAMGCLARRDALGIETTDSIGALFIAACEERASTGANSRGPRKLAASLLERLREAP